MCAVELGCVLTKKSFVSDVLLYDVFTPVSRVGKAANGGRHPMNNYRNKDDTGFIYYEVKNDQFYGALKYCWDLFPIQLVNKMSLSIYQFFKSSVCSVVCACCTSVNELVQY